METSRGRKLHEQALHAEESEQFLEALKFEDEAMVAYQSDGDLEGFSEIQAMRFITLRHLYEQTNFDGYLVLAKNAAMASVELAADSKVETSKALPLATLAKVEKMLGNFKEAAEDLRAAIEILTKNPSFKHSRKSVIADFEIDLLAIRILAGEVNAINEIEDKFETLKNSKDASEYELLVWLSGGYLNMAEAVFGSDKNLARVYFDQAKKIIEDNDNLTIRKQQLEKLGEKLGF